MLTVSTMDCCIPGDHWGVFMNKYNPTPLGRVPANDGNCGTGSDR